MVNILFCESTEKTMIPYQKQKIENAICFFAKEYKYKTGHNLYSTYLYKFLAFLDFECIKEHGRPSLGLKYLAMERGPVPIDVYDKRHSIKSDCFEFKSQDKDNTRFFVIPKGEPDTDYFSDYEIHQMYRLIEIYADTFVKTKDISEASHESIMAWRRAYKRKPNSIMEFQEEFPGNILTRSQDKITVAEENLISFLSLEQAHK